MRSERSSLVLALCLLAQDKQIPTSEINTEASVLINTALLSERDREHFQ